MKWCLVMLILAGVTRADNSVDADYSILKCPDLNSQEEIDLNEVSPLLSLSLCPYLLPSSHDYVIADSCGPSARSTRPIVKIL